MPANEKGVARDGILFWLCAGASCGKGKEAQGSDVSKEPEERVHAAGLHLCLCHCLSLCLHCLYICMASLRMSLIDLSAACLTV